MQVRHDENEDVCSTCAGEYATLTNTVTFWLDRRFIKILVSFFLFIIGLVFEFLLRQMFPALILFLIATSIAGYTIVVAGITQLVYHRKLNIAFLMTIATVSAFIIGHAAEGAAIMVLYYIAEFLENKAKENTQQSVASLMKLAPETANVKRGDTETQIHVHEVLSNETVVVRPGEKIPLDGVVVKGSSSVNQAPITGESFPVTKKVNDEVYAGTINNEGYLEIQVTRLSDETVLTKILTMVETAQKLKSSTEKFIDKFTKYYTPSVVVVAILVAILPPLLLGLTWSNWIYRALILLVISCPCAFAIATPVAMVSALTSAAQHGVLIKGSQDLEALGNVKTVAFDKTGTLTAGKLQVTDIIPFDQSEELILQVAASIETYSEHPISQAIVKRAMNPGLLLNDVDDFFTIPGEGVSGTIEGEQFFIGSERLFAQKAIIYPQEQLTQLKEDGKTVVLVGKANQALGAIAIQDTIRSTSVKALKALHEMGIKTVMITGDNSRTAEAIAKQIGIDEYYAELLPEDKVKIIKAYQQEHGSIAMVGDGVNDAPALVSSDIGIAMGAIGSDAAIETADVALMQDDLSKLPYLFKLSRKAQSIVRQNIGTSLLVKFTLAALVFPGLISLWLAVAVGDMGLSLAVILNAMRLSSVNPD